MIEPVSCDILGPLDVLSPARETAWFPFSHTVDVGVCRFGTVARRTVPFSHTVEPSVCRFGTMEAGMVPISHTVAASVCRFGTMQPCEVPAAAHPDVRLPKPSTPLPLYLFASLYMYTKLTA